MSGQQTKQSGIETRRPIRARNSGWVVRLAGVLCRMGVTPNAVSVSSVAFALLGAAALVVQSQTDPAVSAALLLVAIACIGLRSLANLIDGMIAVEGGRGTPAGPLYNEFPDRVSDAAFFIAAGYAAPTLPACVALGWSTALLAVTTAYVRALATSAGAPQDFTGPMAKPHRMALLAIGCAALAAEQFTTGTSYAMPITLGVIALGCVITIARRLRRAARALGARS